MVQLADLVPLVFLVTQCGPLKGPGDFAVDFHQSKVVIQGIWQRKAQASALYKGKLSFLYISTYDFSFPCSLCSGTWALVCGVTTGRIKARRREADIRLSRESLCDAFNVHQYCEEWKWLSFPSRNVKLVLSSWGDVESDWIVNKCETLEPKYVWDILAFISFSRRNREIELY